MASETSGGARVPGGRVSHHHRKGIVQSRGKACGSSALAHTTGWPRHRLNLFPTQGRILVPALSTSQEYLRSPLWPSQTWLSISGGSCPIWLPNIQAHILFRRIPALRKSWWEAKEASHFLYWNPLPPTSPSRCALTHSHTHTHTHTHTLSLSLSHTHTHTLTYSPILVWALGGCSLDPRM